MSKYGLMALLASAGVGALWLPAEAGAPPPPARAPFAWKQGEVFRDFEQRFSQTRGSGCAAPRVAETLIELAQTVEQLEVHERGPLSTYWETLEQHVFDGAVVAAACPEHAKGFAANIATIQSGIRAQSVNWDLRDPGVLARLYRLRYGLRAAFEEVILQARRSDLVLTRGDETLLQVPRVELHGVVLQSGDILLSRGGAPTSALIARGNDRPGNFSHVALVHVDRERRVSVIESHIESGVGVFSAKQYLKDKKLRIMVMRLASDHPLLKGSPDLPHQAVQQALEHAQAEPPGYDFAMDFEDNSRMFCSEVVYDAYRSQGIRLWKALSSLSGPAVGSWLAVLGVEHFETLAPSDLEYDPQLRVVAEWRDPDTLFDDHVDNAIVDALLGRAEEGLSLEYEPAKLGLARAAKAYSTLLNIMGKQGPIPEGMAADAALRVERLRYLHKSLDTKVRADAKRFEEARGYTAPYWELVTMAERHADTVGPL